MWRSKTRAALLGASLGLLALLSLTLAGAAAANPTWLAPVKLAGSSQAESLDVATDPAGAGTVVFDSPGEVVQAIGETPFVATAFGPAVAVSRPSEEARDPRVALDGEGVATVAWNNHKTGGIEVATVTGGIASAPTELIEHAGVSFPSLAVAEDGAAVVAWVNEEEKGALNKIEAVYRSAGGSFGKPAVLSESRNAPLSFPVAAIGGTGEALVVWSRGNHESPPRSVEATSSNSTGTFSSAQVLSNGSEEAFDPAVAADVAGDDAVVFSQSNGSKDVAEIVTRGAASAFSAPEPLSNTKSTSEDETAEYPAVGIDGAGAVTVAWMESGAIELSEGPLAGPFSERRPVSGVKGLFPSVAEDAAGDALVSWVAEPIYESNPIATAEATYRPAGGAFEIAHVIATAQITNDFEPGRPPVVSALTAGGDGFAAFRGAASGAPEAALLDTSKLTFYSLSSPASGVAGEPVAFSVAPVDSIPSAISTTWSFGDATSASGASVTHTFAEPGTYSVFVTSTDASGNSATATGKIVISSGPQSAPPPKSGYAGAKLVSGSARAKANGGFRLRVKCIASTDCDKGSVQLTVKVKVDKLPPATIKLGKDKFKAGAGARVYVTFKVSKALLALLRKQKHLKLSAVVTASDFRGEGATTEGKATLKPPKAKAKRRKAKT
jgi:hypothetical protein